MQNLFRIAAIVAVVIIAHTQQILAQSNSAHQVFPGGSWETWEKPEAAGYRSTILESAEQILYKLPTSSMMVVVSGKVVYSYGDIAQVSYLASARKSILSMLYGKYVADGTIDLNRTLDQFGIDEDGGLLPIEKTAWGARPHHREFRCLSSRWQSGR